MKSVRISFAKVLFVLTIHLSNISRILVDAHTNKSLTDASSDTPILGRFIWCLNQSRQEWIQVGQLANGQIELRQTYSGKFVCPQQNQSKAMQYCCGSRGNQKCCSLWETPSLKWGIGVGVIVTLVAFLAVSYTIQVFRACDRCYHECPSSGCVNEKSEFQWDTRWYTVSHEGNRYGVTFHSRRFANEFMNLLEAAYGRWNTANILKIQRDGQDFVILNIFFHDLFTPWFYTQGPIKNDEEWIRSDFSEICLEVQDKIQNRTSKTVEKTQGSQRRNNHTEINIRRSDNVTTWEFNVSRENRKIWTPWTKSSEIISIKTMDNLSSTEHKNLSDANFENEKLFAFEDSKSTHHKNASVQTDFVVLISEIKP